MAIHDLTKKTRASTGQRIIPLGPADNTMRVIKLEKRLDDQEQKLDKILNYYSMATTYLTLTNRVLRELNETELTSSTFSSSRGIQLLLKIL